MQDNDLLGLALKFVELAPLLPPWLVTTVRVLIQVSVFASAVAKIAKWGLKAPNPATDPRWKQRLFKAMHYVDKVAINSTPIQQMDKHRDEIERVRVQSMPPPGQPPSVPPGVGMTLLLVLPILALSCAAPPLQTHAELADGTAQLIGAAGAALEQRIRDVEEDALDDSETRDEAVLRIQHLRTTYAPLEAAYEAVRLAHAAYVDAIVRANAAGRDQPEPAALSALSAAWLELVKRGEMLGLVLPKPPPSLAPLLGGGS